jgi:peroxiredoxin
MKNNTLPLVAAALLAAALAAAMAGCKPAKKAPESLLPSDPDVPPPAAVNDFTMDNLVGEFPGRIRSADYAGNPQLVLFFLPDDDSCAAALPAWNDLQRDYAPRGFTILGLIPDSRPADALHPLVAALDPAPAFPTGRADSAIIVAFGSPTALRVVPTAFLLDASGNVVRCYQGHTRPEWIREDLDALLSGAPLPDHTPAGVLPEDNAA